MKTSFDELSKVPYLNVKSIGERKINLMPYWDGNKWEFWLPSEDKLISIVPVDSVITDYVAVKPAKDSDLYIPFVNFMWQRACWPETYPIIRAICDDFHCLAASAAKLKLFHKNQESLSEGVSAFFAATEIQYICVTARGFFDLLQEIVAIIWDNKTDLLNSEVQRKKKSRKLPKKFSTMILKNKTILKTSSEITNEYFVPERLANEYVRQGEFFQVLREYRDSIVHGYSISPTIFATERGFCINPQMKPFDRVKGWEKAQWYNNNLVSILPWINQGYKKYKCDFTQSSPLSPEPSHHNIPP